jgi:hypothetical protein
LLQHYIKSGKSEKEIKKTIYQFCVSLKIQTTRVCEGITQLFAGEVVYVLGKVSIGPDEVCSFVIGDACGDVYNPLHEWEVMFPPVPKPAAVEQKIPEMTAPTFKVLHLSDTHYDPYYHEGSNAACSEPLCCRLTNGIASTKDQAAGKWGDYRKCDTPKITVDNMLQHIQETHPVSTMPDIHQTSTTTSPDSLPGRRLHHVDGRLAPARHLEPDSGGEPEDPQGDGQTDVGHVPRSADFSGPGQPRVGSG